MIFESVKKDKKSREKSLLFIFLGVIVLLSLALSIWFFKNKSYDFADCSLQNYPNIGIIYSSLFFWNHANYTGLINSLGSPPVDVMILFLIFL